MIDRRPTLAALPVLILLLAVAPMATTLSPTQARGGDWPQILGLDRDGHAHDETLPDSWPANGPARQWSVPVGSGYGGPAVVGGRVVLFHRVDNQDRIEAFDTKSGKSLWKTDFPSNYRGGIDADKGPRCVPVVHQGRVYAYGAAGDAHCVDLVDGKKRWSRSLIRDYAGQEGYFGAGSTPVVAGDKLLVNVGGRSGAGLVALRLSDGKTAWKATEQKASYSSPTLMNIGGQRQAVFVARMNTVGVDPAQGNARFEFPFGKRGPTVNAASPVRCGKLLFVTASYGIGARLVRVDGNDVKTVWANDETLSSQYTTPVYRDGYLYGNHGREDSGAADFRCVEAMTGKVMWSADGFGVAHVIVVGDKLLIVSSLGKLVLARATSNRFERLSSNQAVDGKTRALPALSDGRLFLKTSLSPQDQLICLQVGP